MKSLKTEQDLEFILADKDQLLHDSIHGMQRIEKIVQDLKSFSYAEKKTLTQVDINEDVIETSLRLVWNELKFKCKFIKSLSKLPSYACRPNELGQVIINLLINAADAIDEQGTITLSSEVEHSTIKITVTDNGSGIDEKNLLKLFDPFFTTKEIGKGTGLGLSISQSIIEQHGGKLSVSSILGQGSIFTIILPLPVST